MKIVLYYGKPKGRPDPFADYGNKRATYINFFSAGEKRGHTMYLVDGSHHWIRGRSFQNPSQYKKGEFLELQTTIKADIILDLSANLSFPTRYISPKTLNPISFKRICADKNKMVRLLGPLMPKSWKITTTQEFRKILLSLPSEKQLVLKPVNGQGGKGITFDTAGEFLNSKNRHSLPATLQEFIDTSSGIPGIVSGHHDLRFVFINNTLVWSTVRTPKKGSLCANVGQGGKIKEVSPDELHVDVMNFIAKAAKIIRRDHGCHLLYSIDIGIDNGKPYIFEINDRIGFPTKHAFSAKSFIENLLNALEILGKS